MTGQLSSFLSSSYRSFSLRATANSSESELYPLVAEASTSALAGIERETSIERGTRVEGHPLLVGEIPEIIMSMTQPYDRDALAEAHVTFDEHFQKNRPDTIDHLVKSPPKLYLDRSALEAIFPELAAEALAEEEVRAMIAPESAKADFIEILKNVKDDVEAIKNLQDHRAMSSSPLKREDLRPVVPFLEQGTDLPRVLGCYKKQLETSLLDSAASRSRECLSAVGARISGVGLESMSFDQQLQIRQARTSVFLASGLIPMGATASVLSGTSLPSSIAIGAMFGSGCSTMLLCCAVGAGLKKATDHCYDRQVSNFKFSLPAAPQAQDMVER